MEQTNSFMKTSGTIFDEFGNPLAEFEKDACTWAMLSHFSGALVNIWSSTSAYPWPADHMALEGKGIPLCRRPGKRGPQLSDLHGAIWIGGLDADHNFDWMADIRPVDNSKSHICDPSCFKGKKR